MISLNENEVWIIKMKKLKIAVAGTGYVGLSLAVLFAQNHQVTAVDVVPEKVEMINQKKSPIQDDYIEDFLATIGAQSTCLEIMSNKVVKDIRNRVNRIRNCETANIAKAAKATSEHIEAIEKLKANGKFEFLSEDLKYIAELKLENPELSLSELAAITNPPMTKSSLNRRLKKLCDMANQEETNEQ